MPVPEVWGWKRGEGEECWGGAPGSRQPEAEAESIEWFIDRGPGLSRDLAHSLPLAISKMSLFLGLPAWRQSSLLLREGGGEEPNNRL